MFKKDKIVFGVLLGLAFPALGFLIVEFLRENFEVFKKIDLLYIGCVALNIIIFNKASKEYKEGIARGIIIASFICAIIFAYYKLTV